MSKQQNNGGAGQSEQSVIGVGGVTSGEAGATPGHETMAETGGSGGEPLTHARPEEVAPMSGGSRQDAGNGNRQAGQPEGADLDATAIARGYQDTRSRQASPGSTGLGTPETGGNQDESDLAPPRR